MSQVKLRVEVLPDGTLAIDRQRNGEWRPYQMFQGFKARKGVLTITAGTRAWEPTVEEMDELCQMFVQTLLHDGPSTVVVRSGVSINFTPLD